MIVSDVMTTKMITVVPDDTLSHAANLLRQYQFHHLPVVRYTKAPGVQAMEEGTRKTLLLFEGLLTSYDIDLVVALGKNRSSSDLLLRPWQEQRVAEVMHRSDVRVGPTTSAASAAQLLVERGLNCLPVVEYEQTEEEQEP